MGIRRLPALAVGCLIALAWGCQNPQWSSDRTATRRVHPDTSRDYGAGPGQDELNAFPFNDEREGSLAEFDRTKSTRPVSPRVEGLLRVAHQAFADNRADDARIRYSEVLNEDPDNPDAHHRLGILADRSGMYHAAEKHYVRALQHHPKDADLLNDLGYSYFLQGNAVKSRRFLTLALDVNPSHPHASDNLQLLNDPDLAAMALEKEQGSGIAETTLAKLFNNDQPEHAPVASAAPVRSTPLPRNTLPAPSTMSERIAEFDRTHSPNGAPASPRDTEPKAISDLRAQMAAARQDGIAERTRRPTEARLSPAELQARMQGPSGSRRPLSQAELALRMLQVRQEASYERAAQTDPSRYAVGGAASRIPPGISGSRNLRTPHLDAIQAGVTAAIDYKERQRAQEQRAGEISRSRQGIDQAGYRPDADQVQAPHPRADVNVPANYADQPRDYDHGQRDPRDEHMLSTPASQPQWDHMSTQWPDPVSTRARDSQRQSHRQSDDAPRDSAYYRVPRNQRGMSREEVERQAAFLGMGGLPSSSNRHDRHAVPGRRGDTVQTAYTPGGRVQPGPTQQLPPGSGSRIGVDTHWGRDAHGTEITPGPQYSRPRSNYDPRDIDRRRDDPSGQSHDDNRRADYDDRSRTGAHPLDAYQDMRDRHAAEFHSDLRQMAGQNGQYYEGPATRPGSLSGFDPQRQSWHEYRPEDFSLRREGSTGSGNAANRPEAGDSRNPYEAGLARDYGTGASPSYERSQYGYQQR